MANHPHRIFAALLGGIIMGCAAHAVPAAYALNVFTPSQGGTGIGTASGGDIGNCLKVASVDAKNAPIWTIGSCGSGGGGSSVETIWTLLNGFVQPTTTRTTLLNGGFVSQASSTVAGQLTVVGDDISVTVHRTDNNGAASTDYIPAGTISPSNVQFSSGLYPALNAFQLWYYDGSNDHTGIFNLTNTGLVQLGTTTTGVLNGEIVVDGIHYAQTSPGVQSAVNSCAAGSCPGVYLPAGTYTWTTRVTPKNNVHIRGAGKGLTILRGSVAGDWDFYNSGATPLGNFSITDLTIDLQNGANAGGITMNDATSSEVSRVAFLNGAAGGWFLVLGTNNGLTDGVTSLNNKFIDDDFTNHAGSLEAFLIYNASSTQIVRPTMTNITSPGLGLYQKVYDTQITNYSCADSSAGDIYYTLSVERTTIDSPNFHNCGNGIQGAQVSDNGSFGVTQAQTLKITNPILVGGANSSGSTAIQLGAVNDATIINPHIEKYQIGVLLNGGNNYASSSPTNWSIVGGSIRNNNASANFHSLHPAISFASSTNGGGCQYGVIEDVQIYDDQATQNQRYPIAFDGPFTWSCINITGNRLTADTGSGGTSLILTDSAALADTVIIHDNKNYSGTSPAQLISYNGRGTLSTYTSGGSQNVDLALHTIGTSGDVIDIASGGAFLNQTNGSLTWRSGFSGKQFGWADSGSTRQAYVDYDTGNYVSNGILTMSGVGTSTFAGTISVASTTASSTFANGINLTKGCYAINGVCIGSGAGSGSVTSVTAATPNSTLTLGGTNPVTTSGTINFDLNLGHSNWWTALQNFTNASTSQFTASSSVYLATLGGSVGVGTTTPGATFAVNGAGLFNGNVTLANLTATGTVSVASGAVGSPSLTFTTDATTGFWLNGAGTLAMSVSGAKQWEFGSGSFYSNNSAGPLLVNGSANSISVPVIALNRADSTTGFGAGTQGNINAIVGGNEITRWTSTGFGIGTTSPYAPLSVSGQIVGAYFTGTTTSTSTLAGGLNITGGGLKLGTITSCSGSSALTTNSSGGVECGAISGGSGITALGSGWASTTGTTITFSTTTTSFQGLTFGQTIIPAAGALTFTPTISGTLNTAGLAGTRTLGNIWYDGTNITATGSAFTVGNLIASTTSTSTFNGPLTFGIANSTSTNNGFEAFTRASSTATSTFAGLNIVTGGLTVAGIPSALAVTDSSGKFQAYGGAAACSSNNFVTTISASGGTTCGTSTISGVSLGGTLGALTATDATLTFSGSYTGATARTVGLNLGNANLWTALQDFNNASSTKFSCITCYFTSFFSTSTSATSTVMGPVSFGSTTPNVSSMFSVGTSSPIINIDNVTGKVGILGINKNAGKMSIGSGSNANVNANVFMLIQDPSDARFGASVGDSGVFMKSSGGVYAFDYAGGVPKALVLQEFSGTEAKVGIATTTPYKTLSLVGTMAWTSGSTSVSAQNVVCVNTNTGEVIQDTSPATPCASSLRALKNNIVADPLGLAAVLQMKPVQFTWKPGNAPGHFQNNGAPVDSGFIAEDMQAISPLLADYDDKGKLSSIKPTAILAATVKAIQEQQVEIEALGGSTKKALTDDWQYGLIALLFVYVGYNEWDKRRRK